jgi:hypothetical protein
VFILQYQNAECNRFSGNVLNFKQQKNEDSICGEMRSRIFVLATAVTTNRTIVLLFRLCWREVWFLAVTRAGCWGECLGTVEAETT